LLTWTNSIRRGIGLTGADVGIGRGGGAGAGIAGGGGTTDGFGVGVADGALTSADFFPGSVELTPGGSSFRTGA
jgi:hypothetical protein